MSVQDDRTKPNCKGLEETQGREGEIQREERWKVGRDVLPVSVVIWTLSRLAKSRAPLDCQKYTWKSVTAAAGAIIAFACAKKTEILNRALVVPFGSQTVPGHRG